LYVYARVFFSLVTFSIRLEITHPGFLEGLKKNKGTQGAPGGHVFATVNKTQTKKKNIFIILCFFFFFNPNARANPLRCVQQQQQYTYRRCRLMNITPYFLPANRGETII